MDKINELAEFDAIAAGIAEIQSKGNFIPDMTTKEGYEASKRFVLDSTTPTRTRLATAHKKAKAYWIDGGKALDNKKNEILDILVDIQKPHQDAYKAFDQSEKDKKAKFESNIQDKIDIFSRFQNQAFGKNSEEITNIIFQCGEIDTVEGFYHRGADAVKAKDDAMRSLNELLMAAVNAEAEEKRQAELAEENRLRQVDIDKQQEAMRIQQEKMDAQQAEIDRIKNETEEKAKEEENEKRLAIEEDERIKREEKIKAEALEQAEKQRKQDAIDAENKRLSDIELARQEELAKQQKEQERIAKETLEREADKKHRASIHNAILEVLIDSGISEEDSKVIISLAAKRKLPNLTINY